MPVNHDLELEHEGEHEVEDEGDFEVGLRKDHASEAEG